MPFLVNAQMMKSFENQFSQEAGQRVYRRYGKGPALPVTEGQREEFVRKFVRGCQLMLVIGFVLMGGCLGGAAYYLIGSGAPLHSPFGWAVIAVAIVPAMALIFWMSFRLSVAPERALEGELPVAPELSLEQRKARLLRRLDYHHLALAPLMGLAMVWRLSRDLDPMQGWGRLVWLFPIGFAMLAGFQAFRKFTYEHTRSDR